MNNTIWLLLLLLSGVVCSLLLGWPVLIWTAAAGFAGCVLMSLLPPHK